VSTGRWPDAIDANKEAIRRKPDFAEAHCGLGDAYTELERWDDAIEAYKQAVRINPDDANALYHLADALERSRCAR
jgi:tetratricopeptide (TPR) repeat protein